MQFEYCYLKLRHEVIQQSSVEAKSKSTAQQTESNILGQIRKNRNVLNLTYKNIHVQNQAHLKAQYLGTELFHPIISPPDIIQFTGVMHADTFWSNQVQVDCLASLVSCALVRANRVDITALG